MKGNKRTLVALICLLAVILSCLLAAVLLLGGKENSRSDPTQLQKPVTEPIQEPTTPVATTLPPESTPAPTPAPTEPPAPAPLVMDQLPAQDLMVWSDSFTLSGTAQPGETISISNDQAEGIVYGIVGEDGGFSCDLPLSMGSQSIELTCGEDTATYQVERRYGMQSFSPSTKTNFHADQLMHIRVFVKEGSQLTVTFQGKEVKMSQRVDQLGQGAMDGYVLLTGSVGMPRPKEERNMGRITYSVTCDGITETFESAEVICSAYVKNVLNDKSVTPEGYWNVGSGYIAEITDVSVETLNGKGNHDRSDPNNNYLPKGTVDYCSEGTIINGENEEIVYRLLRCGVRVYNAIKNVPSPYYTRVVDCYYGTLPDHNEINIADLSVEGHHTYLTLDCMWKAPFYFDFEEQEYRDADTRKYYVEKFDARYVDITFCYATQVTGEITIPEDHPLFSSAELIQNTADITLRLWLKTEGGLYGWDAYYNENDQLVFKFLNPVTVTKADNPYGTDLTGVVIMLDVGHGGDDMGALGRDSHGRGWTEKERNLLLALAVRRELESVGATVIMNRETATDLVTQRERILYLKEVSPDYCLAIHHNAAENPEQHGYETGFFYPYHQRAAEHTLYTTREADIYRASRLIWTYYYVARQTVCPIVLTESGYLSNLKDLEQAIQSSEIDRKAVALTQGVCNYYLELSGLYTPPAETE